MNIGSRVYFYKSSDCKANWTIFSSKQKGFWIGIDDYYVYTTRIVFGVGGLDKLHDWKLPNKKAMITISNGKSNITEGGDFTKNATVIRGCCTTNK